MKHSWIFVLLLIIVIGVIFGAFANPFVSVDNQTTKIQQPTPTTKPVDHTASFAIFTNGTFRIFTDPRYHNLSSDVFLEPPNVNIIHVKKEGITYQDFFNTLPMKLSKDCLVTGTNQTFCNGEENKLRFFINGQEESDALDMAIKPNDKLLVTFGNLTDSQVRMQQSRIP